MASIVTGTGVVIAILCFLYTIIVVADKVLGVVPVPGFAILAAMIGFLNGCLFAILGLLGESFWIICQ